MKKKKVKIMREHDRNPSQRSEGKPTKVISSQGNN